MREGRTSTEYRVVECRAADALAIQMEIDLHIDLNRHPKEVGTGVFAGGKVKGFNAEDAEEKLELACDGVCVGGDGTGLGAGE